MNLQLLILSPVLFFQCHTASEPILGTLFCARFLSLPQSHLVTPGHGDKPLLPSQGAFEPFQFRSAFVLPVLLSLPGKDLPSQRGLCLSQL